MQNMSKWDLGGYCIWIQINGDILMETRFLYINVNMSYSMFFRLFVFSYTNISKKKEEDISFQSIGYI